MYVTLTNLATSLPLWFHALMALVSVFAVATVMGDGDDGGGDGGDAGGGDHDDDGQDGDGGPPSPAPGAWRGEEPAADPPAPPAPDPALAQSATELAELRRQNAELERKFNDLGSNYRRTQAALAAAAGIAGPGEPKTPEDVRKERLLTQFFDLFPKASQPLMKRLFIEQPERLAKLIEQDPDALAAQVRAPEERHWSGVAQQTTSKVYESLATAILGAGKTGADLDAETRDELRLGFARWIERDKTGARADRYEQQDPALVNEYTSWFKGRFVDPGRRASQSTVIERGGRTSRLPVGGGGNQPVRTPSPKPDMNDDEAVHKSGWAVAQSLRNG